MKTEGTFIQFFTGISRNAPRSHKQILACPSCRSNNRYKRKKSVEARLSVYLFSLFFARSA
jgi:hypothetical protein